MGGWSVGGVERLWRSPGRRLRHEADAPERVLAIGASAAEQLRAQIVRLAAAVEARLPADESFTRLVSPVVLAQRLRNDLWVFARLARAADESLTAGTDDSVHAVDALGSFLSYFQDVSYQLLRYGDLQAFDEFAAILREAGAIPAGPMARARLAEDCRAFAESAEGCYVAVGRRSDVAGRRFDEAHARAVLARFQQV